MAFTDAWSAAARRAVRGCSRVLCERFAAFLRSSIAASRSPRRPGRGPGGGAVARRDDRHPCTVCAAHVDGSLDGPSAAHDRSRPRRDRRPEFDLAIRVPAPQPVRERIAMRRARAVSHEPRDSASASAVGETRREHQAVGGARIAGGLRGLSARGARFAWEGGRGRSARRPDAVFRTGRAAAPCRRRRGGGARGAESRDRPASRQRAVSAPPSTDSRARATRRARCRAGAPSAGALEPARRHAEAGSSADGERDARHVDRAARVMEQHGEAQREQLRARGRRRRAAAAIFASPPRQPEHEQREAGAAPARRSRACRRSPGCRRRACGSRCARR